MKTMYDLITKKGNTYRIDEANYQKIMASISEGKMFVMAGDVPINISNIAEIPKARYSPGETIDTKHRIEAPKVPFDPNSPGYKLFKKAKADLIKKKGIK